MSFIGRQVKYTKRNPERQIAPVKAISLMVTDHNISSTDSIIKNSWYHVKILLKRFHAFDHEWSHHRISSTDTKVRTTY